MIREPGRRAWKTWILGLSMAGVMATAVLTGMDRVSGAQGFPAPTPLDTVVLTGSYNCSTYSYSIVPYPPAEPEPDDPIPVRELAHYVSISGTGAWTPLSSVAQSPGFGPGVGGRAVYGSMPPAPINLGSGVSASFDGGTAEDCVRFGQAVEAVARALGCVTSPLRTRQGVPTVVSETRFSFVCEGPAASQVHAVGELDRAVLNQRLAH